MAAMFGGSKQPQAQQQPAISGLQIQTSAYGKVIPLVYGTTRIAPNLIWYGDFAAIAHTSNPSGGGGKGGGGGGGGGGKGGGASGNTTYSYQAAVALGLCEGPIGGIGAACASKTETSPAALGLSLFDGEDAQTAWGYLTGAHPDEALGYSGTAYVAGAGYQLDDNGQLPNHNFEVQGFFAASAPGVADADPSLVVTDLLTNPRCGAGFPAARLGDLSIYQAYTLASGLWISPGYSEQQAAQDMLDDIARFTNSAFVWSGGLLSLVPYGDEAISANGYSYDPPDSPLYDLTDDDFLPNGGTSVDPVLVTRKRPADAVNDMKVEFLDRSNQCNTSVIEASDQAMIDQYGLHGDQSQQAHLFADMDAAQLSAQLMLQRQAIRNAYQFTLDQRYILLDPMDIVTVTDARLGLNRQWVRITEITENDDGTLVVAAEEYLAGTGSAARYDFATGSGYSADYNVAPGDALSPVIIEPPVQIAVTGLELWLATAGGPLWGGCDIYVSSDGSTYKRAARSNGPARMGMLSASFANGTDPDTTHTLAVDLSASRGQLLSGTQSDADLGNTLCAIGGELVAYETATLTGSYAYSLGTYLRRGFYGTAIASHASGASFVRLDDAIVKLPYDKAQIGTTIHIKLVSLNLWGGGAQQIADATDYTHVITGPPAPPNVTGFAAQQSGAVVAFAWSAVTDSALKGYDIGYARVGTTDWSAFEILTEAAAGTEMTNAAVPPGTWLFGIRARDVADQLSPSITTATLIVTNPNDVISGAPQAPLWQGTLSGFFLHYTGVLTPLGSKTVDHYAGWDVFDSFVPDPVTTASYTAATVDTGYDDMLRVYATMSAAAGPGESGPADLTFAVDSWLTGHTDPNSFVPWTIGYAQLRYLRTRLIYDGIAAGSVSYISAFTPIVDTAPTVEHAGNVVIASSGTMIAFPTPFHQPPFVTATPVGSSALYATVASISATQCTIHVWNAAGSDVGGTVNWSATGE